MRGRPEAFCRSEESGRQLEVSRDRTIVSALLDESRGRVLLQLRDDGTLRRVDVGDGFRVVQVDDCLAFVCREGHRVSFVWGWTWSRNGPTLKACSPFSQPSSRLQHLSGSPRT